MRMKMVCDDRTLQEISNEFLALKKAQKIRDRTLSDYRKYIDKFLAQSENTLDVEILKTEILDFFAEIPDGKTLGIYLAGAAVSAIVGICAIKLLGYISRKSNFRIFSYYCFAAGTLAVVWSFFA